MSRAAALASSGSGGGRVVEAFVVIQDCRQAVQQVLSHLEEFGVSMDLVYRLELIRAQLGRLEELLALLFAGPTNAPGHDGARFVASLIQAQFDRRSLRALFRSSSQQLARKIVERAGRSGEHYITETPAQWRAMIFSAAGGGLVTAFTAAIKFVVGGFSVAGFPSGLLASLNYAASFVLMHFCGFTLATKQPSMTAAALASAIHGKVDQTQLSRLVDMIARITRSQFAAVVGNLGMVVPAALALDFVWRLRSGHSFLNRDAAHHTVESLQPLRAIPFAALTGVYLWLSSLAAGWLENWAVYHRLPEAITHSRRLVQMVGKPGAARLGGLLRNHISGVGGVVALGLLLGMSPVVGQFLGVPSEVRHVTLSTGALTLAASEAGAAALLHREFLLAGLGILCICLLNFGVSFVLALLVALRARAVQRKDALALLRTVAARLRRAPLQFFFPITRSS